MAPPPSEDTNVEFVESGTGKRRMFEPRFTLGNVASVIVTAVVGVSIYYGIIGKIDSQAEDIATLQVTVQQVPALAAHISVIDNTITLNKASRDKAQDELVSRLDRLQVDVIAMSNQVAALNATLTAQARRP